MSSITQLKELPKALQEFQSRFHACGLDGNNAFQKFEFTSLKATLLAVQPATALGLSHSFTTHPIGIDSLVLRLDVFHESGESFRSEFPIQLTGPKKTKDGSIGPIGPRSMQDIGGDLTYAKKYLLWGAFGLANADDADPDKADGPTEARGQTPPKKTLPLKKSVTPKEASPEAQPVAFLDDKRKERIAATLKTHPGKDQIIADFRAKYLPTLLPKAKVTPSHIQLDEHGDFLEPLLGITNAA